MKKNMPNTIYRYFLLFLLLSLPACRNAEHPTHQTTSSVTPTNMKEAPMLARQVEAGILPPLSERLPKTPKIVTPRQPGKYCDEWRISGNGLSSLTGAVFCFSYTSLLHWSMDWNSWEAGVAERYEILDGGRTFRFHLRPGHKWSDGHPFTTDDIDFALTEVLGNSKLHSNPPRFLKQDGILARYTRLSDTCFQFTFPEPNGMFLLDMVAAGEWLLFPKHYLTRFMPPYITESVADSIAKNEGFESWEQYFVAVLQLATRNPNLPSLRPWRLITPRGKESQRWELLRNPYYHVVDPEGRQLPYFDRIVGKNSSNDETVTLDIVTGKVDFQVRSVRPENIPYYIANQERGDYVVEFYPRKFSQGLFYNMQKKKDPVGRELMALRPFRKALTMAINRDEINKLLNWGIESSLYEAAIVERFRDD
ncbi:hypothetical protein KAH55_13630, partial [bacterium]|nr:hypothetical protein [bacterium]